MTADGTPKRRGAEARENLSFPPLDGPASVTYECWKTQYNVLYNTPMDVHFLT